MTGGKRLGHLLMWAGFVTSAFVATSRTEAVDWLAYSLTAAVGNCWSRSVAHERSRRRGLPSAGT